MPHAAGQCVSEPVAHPLLVTFLNASTCSMRSGCVSNCSAIGVCLTGNAPTQKERLRDRRCRQQVRLTRSWGISPRSRTSFSAFPTAIAAHAPGRTPDTSPPAHPGILSAGGTAAGLSPGWVGRRRSTQIHHNDFVLHICGVCIVRSSGRGQGDGASPDDDPGS